MERKYVFGNEGKASYGIESNVFALQNKNSDNGYGLWCNNPFVLLLYLILAGSRNQEVAFKEDISYSMSFKMTRPAGQNLWYSTQSFEVGYGK